VHFYSSDDCSGKSIIIGKVRNAVNWSLAVAITTTCLFFNQISLAQSGTALERFTQGLSERVEFNVDRFEVHGENPLSSETTFAILVAYLGESRGIDDIANAADALEQEMIGRGFSFYRVTFLPQELTDGVVDLLVTRYRLGSINIKGNNYYSNSNIESSLPVLRKGTSPSTKGIARAIRVANQSAGKRNSYNLRLT
jgi:hemolysin activation/secretion protein